MPSSTTELIKSKLDVVELLRGYLTLTQAGKNFKGLCPFHKEKSPSFMVSPERQSWHCFGCGLGGDIFSFVMKHENIEFGEALRMLAEKAGVELRHENPAEYRYAGLLYDLNDAAKNFFKRALATAPVAKEYLVARGLLPETIETFEIGWAPNEPEALSMQLLNAGSAPQDIIQAGLSLKTDRGLMLDRFRGRIMFPIHNHTGKVVGFTGRILPQLDHGDTGKYINSPETPIFQKSRLLYGFWKSKDAIRDAKTAVIVEGQMDFLMSWQAGIKNVVASSGTALTTDHLHVLRRLAEKLIFLFDDDSAGQRAGERAEDLPEEKYMKIQNGPEKGERTLDLAETTDFDVKVVTLGKYKDPADAVVGDVDYFLNAIKNPKSIIDIAIERYLPNGNVDYTQRENLNNLRIVIRKIKALTSAVQREQWFNQLSRITGISTNILWMEADKIEEIQDITTRTNENEIPPRQVGRAELLFEELVALALAKNDFSLLDECALFLNPTQKEIVRVLASGKRKSDDPEIDAAIDLIVLREPPAIVDEEIAKLKAALAGEYYKERRKIISLAIRNAEAHGNEKELAAALEEMKNLPVSD